MTRRNSPDTSARATSTSPNADNESTAPQRQAFPRCNGCNARVLHHTVRLCWDCKRPKQRHADPGLTDGDHTVGGDGA